LGGGFWSLAAMCLATIGFYGSKGSFWPLASTFLTRMAAAAGMALISSVRNVGGFMGPFLVGWIKDATGSFENGLYALAATCYWRRSSQRSEYTCAAPQCRAGRV
jgi:ACS family tartrate transporter-like MFS transporter